MMNSCLSTHWITINHSSGTKIRLLLGEIHRKYWLSNIAGGLSINSGKIIVSDQAAAFGANMARIYAEDNGFAGGFKECTIVARGNAQVHAFDDAFVEGHDHNFFILFHDAKASVNDCCSVVVCKA